jgi:hypothetical protein
MLNSRQFSLGGMWSGFFPSGLFQNANCGRAASSTKSRFSICPATVGKIGQRSGKFRNFIASVMLARVPCASRWYIEGRECNFGPNVKEHDSRMSERATPLLRSIDLVSAERREINASGPLFRIVHRFRKPGTECAAGEWIAVVHLVYRSGEFPVRLSLTLLLVFDYLARQSYPQNKSLIAATMRTDPFYRKHGSNATPTHKPETRKISRSCIRVYVEQIRLALLRALEDAQLHLDPWSVLVSEKTVTNEVGYRFRARFQWRHE